LWLTLFCFSLPAMTKQYDFKEAKEGAVVQQKEKTRISI
jgi:hypothetical protein